MRFWLALLRCPPALLAFVSSICSPILSACRLAFSVSRCNQYKILFTFSGATPKSSYFQPLKPMVGLSICRKRWAASARCLFNPCLQVRYAVCYLALIGVPLRFSPCPVPFDIIIIAWGKEIYHVLLFQDYADLFLLKGLPS